jgi:hypothetical protein
VEKGCGTLVYSIREVLCTSKLEELFKNICFVRQQDILAENSREESGNLHFLVPT